MVVAREDLLDDTLDGARVEVVLLAVVVRRRRDDDEVSRGVGGVGRVLCANAGGVGGGAGRGGVGVGR